MTQTLALLLDSYRELNSKKMFWIVLAISLIVVLSFAAIGINDKGLTLLWWQFDFFGLTSADIPPEKLYKSMFSQFGVGFWLSWLATILALVSTAGMIPDFIAGGAIELTLSKPIGRLRLFLTKFAVGLLFVALQVTLFSAACFIVIGVRGKSWEPSVFLAIPLVVLFFSYLFSVCALLGLVTRSTIAALLLTLLVWFFFFSLNTVDGMVLQFKEMNAVNIERLTTRIGSLEATTTNQVLAQRIIEAKARGETPSEAPPTPEEIKEKTATLPGLQPQLDKMQEFKRQLEKAQKNRPKLLFTSRIIVTAKTLFPKTSETIGLLRRWLERDMALPPRTDDKPETDLLSMSSGQMSRADQKLMAQRIELALRGRTVSWVLGTSLAFEAIILGLGAWIFCRRDF